MSVYTKQTYFQFVAVDKSELRTRLERDNVRRFEFLIESLAEFEVLETILNVNSEMVCSTICYMGNATDETMNAWALLKPTGIHGSQCMCLRIPDKMDCYRGYFGAELQLLDQQPSNKDVIYISSHLVNFGPRCQGICLEYYLKSMLLCSLCVSK